MKEISKKQVALGVAGATVGLVSAGSVFAADGNTWTGLSVYGGIGYNTLSADESTDNYSLDMDNEMMFSGTHSKNKVSAAIGLAYDKQINDKLVVGVFAEYNFGNTKTSNSAVGYYGNYTYNTSASVKDAMSLGVKLGVPLSANDLVYVSGGLTRAKVGIEDHMIDYYGNSYSVAKNENKTGTFIGLGLEHKVSDKLAIMADYRWTNYGTLSAHQNAATYTNGNYNGNFLNHSGKVKTQALSLNLKYTF